jgi:2-octaprenyl-3-methyl-6-methoxy-1,4-benzoquinol hydroxylase
MRGFDADIAVVGAGIVGASLALGLARAGWRVSLVEAQSHSDWRAHQAPDLRVYALAQASAELLRELGLWPVLRQRRLHAYRRMRIWDAGAAGELCFDASDIARPELGWICEQAPLQDALWNALQSETNVEVNCPATVESLELDDAAAVLRLSDGRRLRSRLLLAADGAHSPTRVALGIETDEHDYEQRAVVAYVQHALPHQDCCWQRFLPSGPLAFLPCADGRSSIVWTLPSAEAERVLSLNDRDFAAELECAFDARLGTIDAVSERAAFPLRRRVAERFVQGRAALLGDAARNVHPLAGQGLNLGLADVRELLDTLGTAERSQDPGRAAPLARYARARRSDSALAAFAFEGLNRLYSNDVPALTLLRGPALGLIDRVTPLKRFFASHAAGWKR